jgi:hypothetical protein
MEGNRNKCNKMQLMGIDIGPDRDSQCFFDGNAVYIELFCSERIRIVT